MSESAASTNSATRASSDRPLERARAQYRARAPFGVRECGDAQLEMVCDLLLSSRI